MQESADVLAVLQHVIDESATAAGPAMRKNFTGGGWAMSAQEFVAFWGTGPMSTVSSRGRVHAVPLDVRLVDGRFYIPTFTDSVRLRDHRASPRCAITSWDGPYEAVIVYGRARETDADPTGRTRETATEQSYPSEAVVTVEVTPTRIYAIRPPEGHRARAQP